MIHPLTDARRILPLEKKNELVTAHPDFQLVISYNPGYQSAVKDLKESTKQRFVAIDFDYPAPDMEAEIVCRRIGRRPQDRAAAGRYRATVAQFARSGLGGGRFHPHADLCRASGRGRRRPGGGIAGEHRSADHRRFGYARSADGCDRGVPLEHVCLELNCCT